MKSAAMLSKKKEKKSHANSHLGNTLGALWFANRIAWTASLGH